MLKKEKIFKPLLSPKGLSLIEMLIVVAILGFVMTYIVRNIGDRQKKAKIQQARILIGVIESAREEFNYDCGFYPKSLEDLIRAPADCEEWGPKPYLKNAKIPKDPWKEDFRYEYDENSDEYVIISWGGDRKPGGSGKYNKDISSVDL